MRLYVQASLGEKEKAHLRQLLPADIEPVFESELPGEKREAEVGQAHLVFGNPPAEWLGQAPNLLWVQLHSVGFDKYQHLSIAAPISNMKGFYAQPCAETAIAGILALYRKMDWFGILRTRQEWIGQPLRSELGLLLGKNVLLLGTGSIAQACRKILSGFDCDVSFFGRTSPEARFRTREDLIAAVGEFDVIINCLPGTEETRHFVSGELLARVKPGAIFANVGRGSTVDEAALVDALRNGTLAGAALDVTEHEPLPAGHPLWDCPNVVLSQHTGGGFADELMGLTDAFLRNLKKFRATGVPDHIIEPKKGY